VQHGDLAARAGEALDAMRARGDDEQRGRCGLAEQRGIDCERLVLRAARARMQLASERRAMLLRRFHELVARLGVATREVRGDPSRRQRYS
jgi:hypothetical protein